MKILILCQSQFGYHSDTWYYSKYLTIDHEIIYLGWDYNEKKKILNGVDIRYVSRNGNKITRSLRYLLHAIKTINQENPDFTFIKYFQSCFILKLLFPFKKYLFDIRTGNVSTSFIHRKINDALMKFESFFFSNISIISEGLRVKLRYPDSSYILPLGSEVISPTQKKFNDIRLLYVGTLSGRKIDETIMGLFKYCEKFGTDNIHYTIIGNGWNNETNDLKTLVKRLKLNDIIHLTGHIHHENIKKYFDTANIGVSYVPQTDFFNHQPVTKTYEYLLSGMAVIATNTMENAKVVDENNGVLIKSDSEGFHHGLIRIKNNLSNYRNSIDTSRYKQFMWVNIVMNLENHLKSLIK